MEPVALDDLLDECRAMIGPLAAARGVRALFPQASGRLVKADHTRLKQVLLNLLSNAVKYNREGGAVVVDCAVTDGARVRLSVQDTGLGLRPDQLDRLFQPFNRLGQENGTQEGTGIGLVVTRRLVELMGGAIGVSSSPGVGSLFWIELDGAAFAPGQAQGGATAAPAPASAVAASEVPHLLLYVEDNPANLRLVQEIVRFRPDLRLLAASDGYVGLSLARAHLPDIVLMDLNLPGLDGFELLRELRRDPRTAAIPAIALTANAMEREIERGLAAGFFRYLTKPLDIERFSEAIDATLAQLAEHERERSGAEHGVSS
jgi:CheY-like chemotaxis protein/anti-sigma regulatory factor (Ser/Thr protein kinase)